MDMVSREDAEIVYWIARGKGNQVQAPTAKEAVEQFLKHYKTRSFGVYEYRNHRHFQLISLVNKAEDRGCESFRFASRDEAKAFLNQ